MQKEIRIIVQVLWNSSIIGLVISSEFVRKQEFELKKIKIPIYVLGFKIVDCYSYTSYNAEKDIKGSGTIILYSVIIILALCSMYGFLGQVRYS